MNAHTIRLNLSDRRPLLASLRRRELWLKSIAVVVTVAFLGLYLQPLAIAANLPSRAPAKAAPSNEERLAQALEAIERRLDQLHTKLSTEDKGAKAETALRSDINTLDQTTRQGLNEVEKGIKTKTPRQALLERHTKSIAAYQRAITALSTRADQTLKEGLISGTTNERLSLQALRASVTKLDKNTRDGLNYIGRDLKDKKANAAILKRHKNVDKQYQTDITNVKAALDTWATAMADTKRTAKTKPAPTHDTTKDTAALKSLRTELDALDRQAIADFNAIEQHIKGKNLPGIIMQRHREAVATYETEMAAVKANLDAIGQATDDKDRSIRVLKARDHLKAKQAKKGPKTKFDPNDLPNKSLQPNPDNKPKLTPGDFVRAGLINNPSVKLAAHGSFRIDQLPSASDPAYVAATTEVTLTDAIRAKAAELNHNPVQIYNWVRNNVEWIPTWGATQDADITLGSKRGNAMDIASLLIALLRASDIPARYAHGAIEVPADKFMNWAGGFTDVKAAGDYASSGGVPITGIVSGGRIVKFQMEHVWVEAAVDFLPSRGAINKSADSWVSLDASYKQYEDVQGVDVAAVSGIDAAGVTQSFAASGTINTQEGWMQGLNTDILQSAHTQGQFALEQHISSNFPNPTLGDLFGARRVLYEPVTVLPASLPIRPVAIGARYGAIPSQLEHRMTLAFGLDPMREPINPVSLAWSKLNNHKLTLSFRPASDADQQVMNSYMPSGPVTDLSQLPSSFPSYLAFVVPQLTLDGEVIGEGYPMRLGEDLEFFYEMYRVGQGSHTYTYKVPAGSYLAVAVAGGSVSRLAVSNLGAKVQEVRTVLASRDVDSIAQLTQQQLVGDLYYAGVLSYFGQYIGLANVMNANRQARHNLHTAYGTLGYEVNVHTLFGFPRAIKAGGVAVNVRLSWTIQTRNGDMSRWRDLNMQTGMLSSALEHIVPEQMFSTSTDSVEGVSAAKALQMAMQQGQRIYHLTPSNMAQALPNLRLDGLAMSEISEALSVGREVIAHTDRISVPGWQGEGYVLFDPTSGAGAYKITGGSNGGVTELLTDFANFVTATALGFVDGRTQRFASNVYMFSDELKYLAKWAKVSGVLGLVSFFADLYSIWTNDSLDLSSKFGRTAMAALGFAITAVVTAGLAFWFAPLAAALMAMVVAFIIALAINVVNNIYFTLRDRRRYHMYV